MSRATRFTTPPHASDTPNNAFDTRASANPRFRGRVDGDGDGLADFKKSIATKELPWFLGKYILNRHVYSLFVQERAVALGLERSFLESSNFFPVYRYSPVQSVSSLTQ